ncbi:MAG TPA: nickel-dependent lactate racemase [Anaerolineaceae bacterium]|nr:nickel-dependent lactate racemase [Anaerolineaceae bacterium]
MPQTLNLPWGRETIDLSLPESWQVIATMKPASLPGVPDLCIETERALQNPLGMARLCELARPGIKIALVIDDGSRPTPVGLILPAVLEELERGGASLDQITVMPALGLHHPMSDQKVAERLGCPSWTGIKVENPACDDPSTLADLGRTSRGSPVLVNRTVANADLVVSIGCIEPHIIASFGGGYKNIFPGVAGRAMIAHNHSLNCTPRTFNNVGQPIEQNPMRLDLEEAGDMLKPPVFIVNAVLNSALEVVRVVAGHPVQAHRAGVQVSAQIYGVKVPARPDIVITDSHPMDSDLRQGVKALANTIRAVRRGGLVITLVRAEEGVGVFGLANRKLPLGKGALRIAAPVLLPLVPKLKLNGLGEEDKFFLYFALQAMRHATLLMYAPTIPAAVQANLPFVDFIAGAQAAVDAARLRFPTAATVLVFPHGGSTYPILP